MWAVCLEGPCLLWAITQAACPWSVNAARSEDCSTHHTLRCNGFNEGMSSGCHTHTQRHRAVRQHAAQSLASCVVW